MCQTSYGKKPAIDDASGIENKNQKENRKRAAKKKVEGAKN